MWRYGFETPRNDNDHETNCGGFGKQWNYPNKGEKLIDFVNSTGKQQSCLLTGMCGVCGDAYDIDQPRPNELGGKYGLGVIGANLTSNQILEVEIELTAYHRGYIQMRLCPHNRRDRPVAQTCLDKHLLFLTSGGQKFYPKPPEQVGRFYKIQYNLPADLTCSLCVLQWRYVAGNNWGDCPEGPGGWECGNQVGYEYIIDLLLNMKFAKDSQLFSMFRRNLEPVLMFKSQLTLDGLIPLPMKTLMRMVELEISLKVVVLVQFLRHFLFQ